MVSSTTRHSVSAHATRLFRLFTPEYACRINSQLVYPSRSLLVKPNELLSALARPRNTSIYEPDRDALYLAATLSFGILNALPEGHPFMDGNKRTAFFLANEYLRAQGMPGLLDDREVISVANCYIGAAAGKLDINGFTDGLRSPTDVRALRSEL